MSVTRPGLPRLNVTRLVLLLADVGRKRRRQWDTQNMIRHQRAAPMERGSNCWRQACFETTAGLGHSILARPRAPATPQSDIRSRDRQQAARCDVVKIRIGDLVSAGQIRSARLSSGKRQEGRFNLSSSTPLGGSILAWLERRGERLASLLLRAGSITLIISAHGNMPGSLMSG